MSFVRRVVEEEDTFVVVLIGERRLMSLVTSPDVELLHLDEVESLTSARAGAMAGTEPSDALRVWPACRLT